MFKYKPARFLDISNYLLKTSNQTKLDLRLVHWRLAIEVEFFSKRRCQLADEASLCKWTGCSRSDFATGRLCKLNKMQRPRPSITTTTT